MSWPRSSSERSCEGSGSPCRSRTDRRPIRLPADTGRLKERSKLSAVGKSPYRPRPSQARVKAIIGRLRRGLNIYSTSSTNHGAIFSEMHNILINVKLQFASCRTTCRFLKTSQSSSSSFSDASAAGTKRRRVAMFLGRLERKPRRSADMSECNGVTPDN